MSRRVRGAKVPVTRGATALLWGAIGVAVVVLAVAVLLKWYQHLPDLEDPRWRILLTALGMAAGAWVCLPIVVAAGRLPWVLTITGLAALVTSQACYYALVWGPWKASASLWRVWWVSLVLTVAAAHISWVRLLIAQPQRRRWVTVFAKTAWTCTAIALPLWIGLVLGRTPLPDTSPAYQFALFVPAGVGAVCSLVLMIRGMRIRIFDASPLQKLTWGGVAVACALLAGFYVGRITAPAPASIEAIPAALAHLSMAELDRQLSADFRRLRIVVSGLDDLAASANAMHARLTAARSAEQRDYYRPAEEDEIRSMFMSYLAYRAALLRIAATYSSFMTIPDPGLRARSFLVGYCAGVTVMDASQRLVNTYRPDDSARRKLNEPDAAAGLPAGTFDRLYTAVTAEANIELITELGAYLGTKRDAWQHGGVMSPGEFAWLDARIDRATRGIHAGQLNPMSARFEQIYARVKRDLYSPVYASQSVVSTLIGDTRMVSRPPFIGLQQVRDIQPMLQPGDICLERRNWFMSNAFLPGFWPHAALYVGTIEDLAKLGVVKRRGNGWTSDHAAVRDHLQAFLKPAEDGQPNTILESVSEGVIPNSLTHSMHADYVAVLRPRKLSDADRAAAIVRAFSHVGKPYDFEFDFFSADKLVCTELVYRSYDGLIAFDLVPIMGRSTLPALEIAKKFAAERTRADRDLDFVLFLDAVPAEQSARLGNADDFCDTIARPRGFNE